MKATYEVIEKWFDCFSKGNINGLFDLMDENIRWKNCTVIPGVNEVIPWLGTYQGIHEVKKTFDMVGKYVKSNEKAIGDIAVDGDTAYIFVYEFCTMYNGRVYRANVMFKMRVANYKVIEWEAFWDTAEAVAAFRDIYAPCVFERMSFDEILESCGKDSHLSSFITPGTAQKWENGMTLLMLAAGSGVESLVEALIKNNADVNSVDKKAGAGALHKACQGGHLSIIKMLLAAGAFINSAVYTTGHTPIFESIWYKMDECVKFLLENNALINSRTNYGFTIDDHIEYALTVNLRPDEREKLDRIKFYLEQRRKSDEQLLKNSLLIAIKDNDLSAAEKALKNGESVDAAFPFANTLDDGNTVLAVAARDNYKEAANLLMDNGANVNAIEPIFGAVPLHKATYNGNADILAILISSREADIDAVGATNGYTPLHDALWHGFDNCADQLIDQGANLFIKGHDGKLPIDIAISVFGTNAPITEKLTKVMKKAEHS